MTGIKKEDRNTPSQVIVPNETMSSLSKLINISKTSGVQKILVAPVTTTHFLNAQSIRIVPASSQNSQLIQHSNIIILKTAQFVPFTPAVQSTFLGSPSFSSQLHKPSHRSETFTDRSETSTKRSETPTNRSKTYNFQY